MKIKELIEHLQTLDPELDVLLSDDEGDDIAPLLELGGGYWQAENDYFTPYTDSDDPDDETLLAQEDWTAVVLYP